MKCRRCHAEAEVALPSHHTGFCRECFGQFFTRQVERAVKEHAMFSPGERILVALSGGKDSLALFHQLHALGHDVTGLHVDLGIPESSGPSRAAVERFCRDLGAPLRIVETASMGLPIPAVKRAVHRPICAVCGKIKRYVFDRTAMAEGFDCLATGHNLDDEAGRLMANTLRWDVAYLSDQGPVLPARDGFARKVKPLCRLTEYETACYVFFQGIDVHMAPCPYSRGASFPVRKAMLNRLEEASPGSKMAFYNEFLRHGRPAFQALEREQGRTLAPCDECGYPTSAGICGVCRLRGQVSARMSGQADFS